GGKWGLVPTRMGNMNLWYVLYCKTQDVDKITRRVNSLGVSVFCPRYVRVSHRTDCNSVRIDEKVLFPNYLFLSFDINKIHTSTISSIPGAIGFIRFGSDACTVPQKVISAIECARLIALNNDDQAIECRNISPALLLKIQEISLIRSIEQRQVAFSHLLQSSNL
ncbi:transcription termination/antitermination NusG family protein, partial [Candidatus Erwinia dacicola]